jgi:hypothetical protein
MRGHATGLSIAFIVAGWVFLPAGVFTQQALSHARVVRLSYASGTVGVKRSDSTGWTNAMVNTPIQEGFELSTSATSYAEVEFENGSTVRLGELSQVVFSQLALDAEGNKLNRLTFEQGYATFHFIPEHNDAYSVMIADAALTPSGKSEFRADLNQGRVRIEVINGTVDVTGRSGSTKLSKDRVLEFNSGAGELAFDIQQGITKDAWDKWTEARDTQEQLSLREQAIPAQGLVYGWGDLGAYGEWAFIPGYGYGWAPYAPMGWMPYSMGMWANYAGFGPTWISSEPWGWLPYHCGGWSSDPLFGWFWMPGGCDLWQPALVTWYSGPGWIGWQSWSSGAKPYPVHGQPWPGRPLHGQPGVRSVTAVPLSVVQNGQMITPQIVNHVRPADGTVMERSSFQSLVGATNGIVFKTAPAEVGARAPAAAGRVGAQPAIRNTPAPATILMGGDAAAEKALLQNHSSALGRAFGLSHAEPLHAREGSTLGGRYAMGGAVGEFRGDAFSRGSGSRGMRGADGVVGSAPSHVSRGSGPVVLAHGQSTAPSSVSGGAVHSGGGSGSSSASASSSVSVSSGASGGSHGGGSSTGGGHH